MAIDPEYLVRSLIEIKERMARLEQIVTDGFAAHKEEIQEVKDIRDYMIRSKTVVKIVSIIAIAITSVSGIIIAAAKAFSGH